MKVQVIYSSLSGRTKKLAERIYEGLQIAEKSLHDLADGEPALDGDVLLLGYWVDKGGPNAVMAEFMKKVNGKTVGVFCTLGYYADSAHGQGALNAGVGLLKDNNRILGGYVCNGALSKDMIECFRNGRGGPHGATLENEIRWKVMENHPTEAEIALGVERFRERIEILRRFEEGGGEFRSVL